MTDSSGWWARKLGAQQNPPAPQPQAYQQNNYPGGYQQQPPPQQQLYAQPQPPPFDPSQAQVTTANLFQMAGHWKGGPAHRTDTDPCPQCGSPQFFSRTNGGMSRLPPPAPHCYNCGYNGLFSQGDPTTWGATG